MNMTKVAVLASGGGTNLQSIIDAAEAGTLGAEVALVISDKPEAFALERAKKHSIKTAVVTKKDYPSREAFDKRLIEILKENSIELVVLAGFMRIISKQLIDAFPMRIMNIHPSLLPAFPGLDVQQKAIDYGVKFSGCTVHFIDEGVDTGPIIIQAAVPVTGDDTAESLSSRILKEEHRIYPEAIRLFCQGRLEVNGRKVFIKDKA
ncbi:Phosphoribosylglycinamide formyltransferase [hydrothermal vent metagenome]|uniref:phosphoribosylglycinamide formyltransferase 1 n=1 Tax=hydrothermal vent metagenome TaxID=652676 RepID=A0A3B0QSW7_9ZZZZ